MSSVKLKLTKMLLFVSFGLKYIYYSLILFLGVSESCIICFCLILLAFLFVYLYLFGLNRGLKILFGLFWLPKSPLLPRSGCDWEVDSKAACSQFKYVYLIMSRRKITSIFLLSGLICLILSLNSFQS